MLFCVVSSFYVVAKFLVARNSKRKLLKLQEQLHERLLALESCLIYYRVETHKVTQASLPYINFLKPEAVRAIYELHVLTREITNIIHVLRPVAWHGSLKQVEDALHITENIHDSSRPGVASLSVDSPLRKLVGWEERAKVLLGTVTRGIASGAQVGVRGAGLRIIPPTAPPIPIH